MQANWLENIQILQLEGTCQMMKEVAYLDALRSQGIVFNDPIAKQPYAAQAIRQTIHNAKSDLFIMMSDVSDESTIDEVIRKVEDGVHTKLYYRDYDPNTIGKLQTVSEIYSNFTLEPSRSWRPYPHLNTVIADNDKAFIGTTYIWSPTMTPAHHTRGYDNGILIAGQTVKDLHSQLAAYEIQQQVKFESDAFSKAGLEPDFALPRSERMQQGSSFYLEGEMFEILGSNEENLILQNRASFDKFIPNRALEGRTVIYEDQHWTVSNSSWKSLTLQYEGTEIVVPKDYFADITVEFAGGQKYALYPSQHNVFELKALADQKRIELPVSQLVPFQSRIKGHELDGPYSISLSDNGALIAEGRDKDGFVQTETITAADLSGNYSTFPSIDFNKTFPVDSFLAAESINKSNQLLSGKNMGFVSDEVNAELGLGEVIFDRAINLLETENSGSDVHIWTYAFNSRDEAASFSNALIEYKAKFPEANITLDTFWPEMDRSEGIDPLNKKLVEDGIITLRNVPYGSKFQLNHAKGMTVGDRGVLTTASFTHRSLSKADITLDVPSHTVNALNEYVAHAFTRTTEEFPIAKRTELLTRLAQSGIVFNDPIARVNYAGAAPQYLVSQAQQNLTIWMSDINDYRALEAILDKSSQGVDIEIYGRDVHPGIEAALLGNPFGNIQYTNTKKWPIYPHFNVVVADQTKAFVGTSYLWDAQVNTIHHGRGFESGMMIENSNTIQNLNRQLDHFADNFRIK
jgi:hypothetical protein